MKRTYYYIGDVSHNDDDDTEVEFFFPWDMIKKKLS